MARKKEGKIGFYEDNPVWENMEKLKKVYNIKTRSWLVQHIVNLDMNRHWLWESNFE